MIKTNKYTGCLIGGAAGDALGYPVEFMRDLQIISAYGNYGITEYALKNGVALFSDDTQMSLFTATALLTADAENSGIFDSDKHLKAIAGSYIDWLKTKNSNHCSCDPHCWLANINGLYSSRGPGLTCLDAISSFSSGTYGTMEKPINDSKGCGGIMRVAPIGLWGNTRKMPIEEIALLAAKSAALTHGHILGYIPAAAMSHIIYSLVSESCSTLKEAVEDAMRCIENLFEPTNERRSCLYLMNKAVELANSGRNDIFCINTLGQGWVAEETLAIAIFCAMKYHNDFERAIITAVNHSGDSDSTGSVTGNILGAYLGIDAIGEKFRTNLELYELIETVAEDLAAENSDEIENFREKYIEKTFKM